MKGLIAKRPILYRGRMYRDGENLPGDDTRMVAAWLENDSAELCGAEQDTAMGGREEAQETPRGPENTPEVSGDTEGQGAADGGQEAREQAGEGETGGMIAANDMGLDISKAKTKADLIAAITAAEVYAPAEDENGGAL